MASDNELLIKLGVESSSVTKQIREVTKELKTLDKEISAVDKSFDGYNQGVSSMGKQASLFQDKLKALNTQLDLYESKLSDAGNAVEKAKKKLADLGERTEDNKDAWDKANKALETAQTKYNNMERAMRETESQIKTTTSQLQELKYAIEDMGFDKFTKEVESLESDLQTLDKKIASIDTSSNSFIKNMNGMGEQTELYKDKLSLLNNSIYEHKKQLDSTKNSIKTTEDYLDSLGERTEENADDWDKACDHLEKYRDRQHDLENSLEDVQSELRETTNELVDLNQEMAKAPFDKLSSGLKTLSEGLGTISQITQPVSTAIAGVGTASLKTAMDFEDAMAKVQATAGVSSEELEILSNKAREIGKNTQLSASEGAEALLLLAQAGYTTEQSLSMVDAVVNLAIANEMDLARATDIVTSAMNAFGWEMERSTEMTDMLSVVARASATDVGEVGEAFKTVAPTANALGFEVSDVATVLGLLANQAIRGGEAGNGLKSILSSLVKPTKNGAEVLKELGVEVADESGKMKDLNEIVTELSKGFSGLSEEQKAQYASTLVGKMQMSKFLALISSSPEEIKAMSKAIEESNGVTLEMREIMEGTTGGAWREFQSKLEETAIVIGNKLLPHFSKLLDKVGEIVEGFANLDENTQDFIMQMGLALAVISPVTGALSTLTGGLSGVVSVMGTFASKIAGSQVGLKALGDGVATTASAIGATGGGSLIGGLTAISTAIAPWLIGGAVVAGLGIATYLIVQNFDDIKKAVTGVSEEWDYGNSLIEEATANLADEVVGKYKIIEQHMKDFESDGISLLVEGLRTLNEDGTNDFSGFLNHCQSEIETAKVAINNNATEITEALGFLNTDIATVFSAKDLAEIQTGWINEMTGGVERAYTELERTINDKDTIIQGLMEEHGYNYEQAYDTWEAQVLEDYGIFCDALIEAQTGYQSESLGKLEDFLMEQELLRAGDVTEIVNKLRDSYGAQADTIEKEYDVLLSKILQGETQINDIKFSSGEQAMKYAEAVRDYKLAQVNAEKEQEIQMAYDLAYQKGIISKAEYEQLTYDSIARQNVYQNEVDALTYIIEEGAKGTGYAWEAVWETIQNAENTGIPASMTRNKEFIDEVTKYYQNGGTDMQEAVVQAFDKVTDTTDTSIAEMEKRYNSLDITTKKNIESMVTNMANMGLSIEQASKTCGVDTELMEYYIRTLATEVEGSTTDIRDEFLATQKTSESATGLISNNFGKMGTRVMSALTEMDGSLITTSENAGKLDDDVYSSSRFVAENIESMGTRVHSALISTHKDFDGTSSKAGTFQSTVGSNVKAVANNIESMNTRVYSALLSTQKNFNTTKSTVNTASSSMRNDINSLQSKTITITAQFRSINFQAVKNQVESMGSHVYSAGIGTYLKDYMDGMPTNFGEDYMQDLYGLKDAGVRTISLANLNDGNDGISAYATKDSVASGMVAESVQNYNASTSSSIQSPTSSQNGNTMAILRMFEQILEKQNSGDTYVNIEVKNGNPQEIIKVLENYLKPRSKKW